MTKARSALFELKLASTRLIQSSRFQEGINANSGAVSAHWIDSWHMDHAAMTCTGTVSGNVISVRGTYAAPPGPDWGWRIDLSVEPAKLRLTMFNISPADLGGGEALAVEAVYRRA